MKRTISLVMATDILCAITISSVCLVLKNQSLSRQYNQIIGILGIVTIVWCGFSLKRSSGSWFSLIYMFELSYYVLTLGQSFLSGIGVPMLLANQYNREPTSDVNSAYLFNILCLVMMHLGIIVQRNRRKKYDTESLVDQTSPMKNVGFIMLALTIIPYAFDTYRVLRVYSLSGYSAAYDSIAGTTSWNKMFSIVGNFFPYVVFLLFIAYKDNKLIRRIFGSIIILLVLVNFAVGNRSEPICYIVALLWLSIKWAKDNNDKRAIKRYSLITGISFLTLMLVIPIIGSTRNEGTLNFSTIFSSIFGEQSFFSIIFSTISSLGYTVFPTIKTMQLIPSSYPYHFGESYLFAILGIFPNVFGGTHISQSHASLAQWLMKALGMTYGPGYSIPAEAFYNFGWFGMLFMPFIGWLISRLLDERRSDRGGLQTFILIGSFIVLYSIPRRDALTACRNIVYYVLLLSLAVRFFSHRKTEL